MKISYRWLQQYLPLDLQPEQVSEYLTDTGLEVEGLTRFDAVPGGLQGVVIGEVTRCEPHPNADRLRVTEVNIGAEKALQIVCGAPNVALGQKVPVATVGTEIFTEDGSFVIKKSKLRGEVSEGMICSEAELQLGNSHEGILVLPPEASIGQAASEYFQLESDYVFEIGLTPNRSDAMSHYGVARDLRAALLRHGHEKLELSLPSVSHFSDGPAKMPIAVEIANREDCYRYCGLSIEGVKVGPSPDWLQRYLRAIGLSPKNNVVDVTNYVLHETGHPLHAFDAMQIRGQRIVVKNLAEGTPFVTLDGSETKLSSEDMMICDAERPLVLAGVYGGLDSGVNEQTQAIFLEAAHFNPVSVRKSAKRHALSTDSSFRYERGVDPEMTIYALKRAALLIQELAGGELAMPIRDERSQKIEAHTVELSLERMNQLIGQEIEPAMVRNILQWLDIRISAEVAGSLHLEVPAYRHDVRREADIVEEVLRIYGFNAIEAEGPMRISVGAVAKRPEAAFREKISQQLSGRGWHEILNNSLTKRRYFENYGFDGEASVAMLNPLSQDLAVMRQSLLFGGLESLSRNTKRQRPNLRFYEFGRRYRRTADGYAEEEQLALWITGAEAPESWRHASQPSDFYSLKSEVLLITQALGLPRAKEKAGNSPLFSESLVLSWKGGLRIELGLLESTLCADLDLKQAVYFCEMPWDQMVALAQKKEFQMQDLARYPEVRRDLALLVDRSVSYGEMEKIAYQYGGALLREVGLFDVYEGKNLPEAKKSYALSFILRHDDKTLNDKAVDQCMQNIFKALEKSCGAQLR